MRAVSLPAGPFAVPLRSRRLLALAGDDRLVEQIARGNEVAFAVAFERHAAAILGFCRHMLASSQEAEDAVQQTFVAAWRDLQRDDGERDIALKPWLFAIARNRCISMLRARREQPAGEAVELGAVSGVDLGEEVERRADLRLLLADLRELPEEQRAALLLTELGDFSHAEVAGVLGCEVPRVKALVFRARSALISHREARETPCEQIREQLATLRRGALRRTELRLHLRDCPGCRAYREQVREQRRMLAAALPVVPTLGLKSSVLAAIGVGGGSAGGLTIGALGGATAAKVALALAVAGGGVVAGDAMIERVRPAPAPSEAAAPAPQRDAAPDRTAAESLAPAATGPNARAEGRGQPPAHAKQRGRPAHAGQPGPPGHSKGRPPAHAKEPGPPPHAKGPAKAKEQARVTEPNGKKGAPPGRAKEPKAPVSVRQPQRATQPKAPARAQQPAQARPAPKASPAPVELPDASPEVIGPGTGDVKAGGRRDASTE